MFEIEKTSEYIEWFDGLKDIRAKAKIAVRLDRLEDGNFGDVKYSHGIGELWIDYGPGYRVYFMRKDEIIVILLICGEDKRHQSKDIERARQLAQEVE